MSLNAYWEPWEPNPVPLELERMTNADFIGALSTAFGFGHDFVYGEKDLPTLKAMAAANSEFQQIVDAIETHGRIRVWAEQ